ncbi:MAG TPA: GGDEF domain-containing protein [Candidatus Saccharimonadales bacterium]|nr:GGDEF domain-containing protein [Candidatus Saccharimonadales bacterium]
MNPVRRHAWLVPLAFGLPAVVAYFALPNAIESIAYDAFGACATISVLIAILLHRPARRHLWWLIAAGFGLWTAGDAISSLLAPGGGNVPIPSLADACYFAGYAAIIFGVGWLAGPMVRGSRGDRSALLDAAIVATTAGFAIWVIVIDPLVDLPGTTMVAGLVTGAYPVLDLLIIAVVARHLLVDGPRPPAAMLLVAGLVTYLVADLAYVRAALLSTYSSSDLLNAGWLVGYTLVAAAALHPSMRQIGAHSEERRPISFGHRVLLGCAAIVPAVVILVHDRYDLADRLVLGSGSALLVGLVLARLFGSIWDQQQLRELLLYEARHDPLTALANRTLFAERLSRALVVSPSGVGLLYLDVDDFKSINDTLGHRAGDEVLAIVAGRLAAALRAGDDVARLGGDEFAVIVEQADDERSAVIAAQRVLEAFVPPMFVAGRSLELTASIGIAWRGRGEASADELLRRADIAMYEAKAAQSGYAVYRKGTEFRPSWDRRPNGVEVAKA